MIKPDLISSARETNTKSHKRCKRLIWAWKLFELLDTADEAEELRWDSCHFSNTKRVVFVLSVWCATHRFGACLLQKLHRLLPFVLLVLLTHLQRRPLLLVFYVLWEVICTVVSSTMLKQWEPLDKRQHKHHVSYPVDLRVLQQELHYLCVASSGCKVQRGAELAIEQVRVTVSLLQQQFGCFNFTVPGWKQTNTKLIIN